VIDEGATLVPLAVVAMPPEVDAVSAGPLRDEFLSTLNRGGVHLVVDARRVTFMDSSGINALVRARERAVRLGGSIHVVTTSRPVLRVLRVAQLLQVMSVLPTMAEARDCISRPALIHSCDAGRVSSF